MAGCGGPDSFMARAGLRQAARSAVSMVTLPFTTRETQVQS